MSKVSFSNAPEQPAIDVPSTVVPAAEVPTVPQLPAVSAPQLPSAPETPVAFDDNDIKFEDIYLPRINIVQRVGDLSVVYNPGEIVLNQQVIIHTPANPAKNVPGNPPLNITILGFKKLQYAEKVSGGGRGLLLNSEADVVKHGGTLVYKEWQQSVKANAANPQVPKLIYFEKLATGLVLIEKPAHITDDTHFPYQCEGKSYALALWSMKGTAFTNAAKHFFTARKIGHLKTVNNADGTTSGGYPTRSWTLTTKTEKFNENFAEIPVVVLGPPNTPAFREFVKEVLGCN